MSVTALIARRALSARSSVAGTRASYDLPGYWGVLISGMFGLMYSILPSGVGSGRIFPSFPALIISAAKEVNSEQLAQIVMATIARNDTTPILISCTNRAFFPIIAPAFYTAQFAGSFLHFRHGGNGLDTWT